MGFESESGFAFALSATIRKRGRGATPSAKSFRKFTKERSAIRRAPFFPSLAHFSAVTEAAIIQLRADSDTPARANGNIS